MCFSPQRRAIFRHQNFKKCSDHLSFLAILTSKCVFSPQRRTLFRHLNLQKCSEHVMFCTFSLPNVLFATAAYNFFDIWTYKSAPNTSCFVHFHFQMCFSPQRRTIFRHLNFKKCTETDVFCTFWLHNVLFATAAGIFSTSELPKVLRHRQFSSIFTSKCGFRHRGVQFLMSSLGTYLRTRRFNRPTFRLTRHTNHWKNTAFRDFSNICLGCIFFLLTFALLHLLPSDLTACLICFSTLHIVGSLLFKLPSIILMLFEFLIAIQQNWGKHLLPEMPKVATSALEVLDVEAAYLNPSRFEFWFVMICVGSTDMRFHFSNHQTTPTQHHQLDSHGPVADVLHCRQLLRCCFLQWCQKICT